MASRAPSVSLDGISGVMLTVPFIGHDHPTTAQQLFEIAVAEREAQVQPDPRADDLGRNSMVLTEMSGWCAPTTSMAQQGGAGQAPSQVDNAGGMPHERNEHGEHRGYLSTFP